MPKKSFTKKLSKSFAKKLTRLDNKKIKAKRKRLKTKQKARLMAFKLAKEDDKRISEDDCDFDFDNSTKPLCSTSEDDSDGPQGQKETFKL